MATFNREVVNRKIVMFEGYGGEVNEGGILRNTLRSQRKKH